MSKTELLLCAAETLRMYDLTTMAGKALNHGSTYLHAAHGLPDKNGKVKYAAFVDDKRCMIVEPRRGHIVTEVHVQDGGRAVDCLPYGHGKFAFISENHTSPSACGAEVINIEDGEHLDCLAQN